MWKGALSIGLVSVPVRLYLATDPVADPASHLLHDDCGSRVQMRTFCPVHDRSIDRAETVRGIEVAPEQYVVLTENELESLPRTSRHAFDIERFVRADDARSVTRFSRQTYYVAPEPIGSRAYGLFRDVLRDGHLLAIGRITLRERERLAAVEPVGPILLLTTIVWPDEIREIDGLELPGPSAVGRERDVAAQLADALTGSFDPSSFVDTHRAAIDALVAAKIAGAEITRPPAPPEGQVMVDLMAALEASIAAARPSQGRGRKRGRAA
jgi:DNA end-binding protein Ku